MKRAGIFLLVLALFALTACGSSTPSATPTPTQTETPVHTEAPVLTQTPTQTEEPAPSAQLPNPIEEVDSADDILEAIGAFLTPPDDATDVRFSIIDKAVGQVDFLYDGITYTARVMQSDTLTDISGVYTTFTVTEEKSFYDYPYTISYNENGEGISLWYDELSTATYSLSMEKSASEAALVFMSEAMIPAG